MLQISLATLTALGTLLLGMGERNVTLPVLAVIVAVSSVYLTDIKGWLQLNTLVANVAGVIALAVTWREWNDYAAEGQLLSLANLLIYLQFVLLYRKKTVRNYWLLLLLSLLQVAVAAALNMSVSFGVLLPAYMFVGLITMALFVVHRAQVAPMTETQEDRGPPASLSSGRDPRRWPLAGRRAAFDGVEPPGAASSGLGWSFLRQIVWLGIATCLLALVWFFWLPRPGKKTPWRPSGVVPYTTVGFSETVTLGQLGEVYENPEEVMQVRFFKHGTKEPYRVAGDQALFRGSVLYQYRRGRWNPIGHLRQRRLPIGTIDGGRLPNDVDLVREEATIRRRTDSVLFTVVPAFALASGQGMEYLPDSDQLLRPGEPAQEFDYELVTTAFKDHLPRVAYPAERKPSPETVQAALEMPEDRDGRDPLAGLRAQAAEWCGRGSPEQKARMLESYLRTGGRFTYSLRQHRRAMGIDPVEAFVTDHRMGHCEYFASALVLMLRSVGIPARLAIGFKGGDYNVIGGYYQIRELHAHAWVEAYVGADTPPVSLSANPQVQKNGAWLILDPTPGRSEAEFADSFGLGPLKRLLDLTQLVWANYVLGLDSQRQREVIYQPLLDRLETALRSVTDEEARERIHQALTEVLVERLGLSHGLFSWQGFLAASIGLLLLVGLWKAAVAALAYLRHWLARRPSVKARKAHHVEFYEQFETLLARHGMPRAVTQTPREFALATGGYLAESPLTRQSSALPRLIVDAFYFVRFGRRRLDTGELASVQQALSQLAAALAVRQEADKT